MLKRAFITGFLLALLCATGVYRTWAQDQPPPFMPPHVVYGTARVDGAPLDRFDTGYTVSMRMHRLLLIFLDSWNSQPLIVTIIGELNAGDTDALQQAFQDSPYCQSRGISLSASASVSTQAVGEWLVYDGGAIYTVLAPQIYVWNGNNWVLGFKLEVYQHYGLIDSYTMGDYSVNEYVLEVPMSSGTVYGGPPSNTYLIRDPGRCIPGEPSDIYINNIKITTPALPYLMGAQAFTAMNIDAPSTYQYTVNLQVGWHLITFPIGYCYYQGNPPTDQPDCVQLKSIAELGFGTMSGWLSSVLIPNNPGTTAWNLVIGTDGMMLSSNPNIDTLKSMSPIKGYWVEITAESGGAVFSLNGPLFDPGCVIGLPVSWSLVGYPLTVGYYDDANYIPAGNVPAGTVWIQVNAPVAEYVFRSIRNQYSMIIGPNGTYVPSLPNINTLHCIPPNSAYWIDMGSAAGLDYSFMGY